MSELDTLLSKAVAETKQLEQGEVFYVRDLFKGYKWNRIPRKPVSCSEPFFELC